MDEMLSRLMDGTCRCQVAGRHGLCVWGKRCDVVEIVNVPNKWNMWENA